MILSTPVRLALAFVIAPCCALLTSTAIRAATIAYANNPGVNDFAVGANWTGGVAPSTADIATIDGVDGVVNYAYLDTARTIQRFTIASANGNSGGIEVRSGGSLTASITNNVSYVGARGTGYLRILNGGAVATSNVLNVGWGDATGHGTGTVTQSGGSYTGNTTAGNITIGVAAADANFPASVGTYNLSNGSVNLGGSLVVGMAGIGTFNMTGGSVTTGSFLQIGRTGNGAFTQTAGPLIVNRTSSDAMVIGAVAGGVGKYEISGGSLAVNTTGAAGVAVGIPAGTSTGTFKVVGNSATSIAITGDYKQYANSNLSLDIGTGVTPINLTGSATLGGALNVSFTTTPSVGQQFPIMNYGGALTGAFSTFDTLVDSPAGTDSVLLSISYGTGSNSSVVLTVVPEPVSLTLFATMLPALLVRRARRNVIRD